VKQIFFAATMLAGLCPAVHAQVIVFDPAAVSKDAQTAVNTAQEVKNGYTMIAGTIHGNGFASLIPGLGSSLSSNPLGGLGGSATSLMSGTNTGGLGGLFNQFLPQVQTYTPQGNDPEAQMLQQRAAAAAGQMSVAQQLTNGMSSRLSLLPQLMNTLGGTADVKDAVDANTRVSAEATTQGAQANQAQALLMYQQAEANAERSREELTARQSADEYAGQAQAAAADAEAGNVTMFH